MYGAVLAGRMLPPLVPLEDEASSKLLERAFRRRGIGYELGTRFEGVKDNGGGVTVSLAGELGGDGIRVNGIAPALVDSEAAVAWWSDPERTGVERIDQVLISQQMIKRQGRMEDVADACLFLCSDAASFMTGQTLIVDGGFLKRPF